MGDKDHGKYAELLTYTANLIEIIIDDLAILFNRWATTIFDCISTQFHAFPPVITPSLGGKT